MRKSLSLTVSISMSILLLSACTRHYLNPFPGFNPYHMLNPPLIQHYQKPDTIGHTDRDKRIKDTKECGVISHRNGLLDYDINYNNISNAEARKRGRRIHQCMLDKGYIFLDKKECVDGKNDRLTGLCN